MMYCLIVTAHAFSKVSLPKRPSIVQTYQIIYAAYNNNTIKCVINYNTVNNNIIIVTIVNVVHNWNVIAIDVFVGY